MTELTREPGDLTEVIQTVISALEDDSSEILREIFAGLTASEIAHVLESIPDNRRASLWVFIPEEKNGEVLVELGEVARLSLTTHLDEIQIVEAVDGLESNDLAEMVESLPEEISNVIRGSLDYDGLQNLEANLAFEEDTAGRIMQTRILAIRSDVTLETVLRYLRYQDSLPENTESLLVIDRHNEFLGELPLSALLTNEPSCAVSEVMEYGTLSINPDMSQHNLAILFREHDLVSVPVVDNKYKLIGRVTLDYMVDAMAEEADHQIMGAVGLDEDEDLFAPIVSSARRRLFWLGINLATAFLAAWVIGLFSATLDKIVALAVLMPIVASMGGIAGSQTLTLMIRGLATGKIVSGTGKWLAYKEIAISLISGSVWAFSVGIVSYAWFNDAGLSLILGVAMMVNLLCAAVAGFAIPMIMEKLKIDPALAGGVVLTTVTDVVGFISFLGLATIFLL